MHNLPIIGIYSLFFEQEDNQYYIGKSTDINYRYWIHCRDLRLNVHHNYKLQKLYKKYKVMPELFILEKVDQIENLSRKEIEWIEKVDSYNNGLNLTGGGEGAGYGHTSPSSLYDEDTYITILFMLVNSEYSKEEIARELDVSPSVVTSISLGASHKHLSIQFPLEYKKMLDKYGNYATSRSLTDNIYYDILYDLATTNMKYNVVASKYGIKDGIIEDIAAGNTHKYLKDKYPELYDSMLAKKGGRRAGPQSGLEYPKVLSPEGIEYSFRNATQFSKEHGLHQGHFAELLKNRVKSHKGWTLSIPGVST